MSAVAGVILAGGHSSRMGRDKALVEFRGRPLIAHAIDALGPQTQTLAISANGDPGRFAAFGLTVLSDASPDQPGPLAGVAAGLVFARARGLGAAVTVPCDAPFVPSDLIARLRTGDGDHRPSVAASERGVEPLFALWPVAALEAVEAALASGETAVWRALESLGARRVLIPVVAGRDWRLNLNSPDELAAAEHGP